MQEPHLTCLYVYEMLRDTGQTILHSTSNNRYDERPVRTKKLTEYARGLTPVPMHRSTLDDKVHKKDLQFERRPIDVTFARRQGFQ